MKVATAHWTTMVTFVWMSLAPSSQAVVATPGGIESRYSQPLSLRAQDAEDAFAGTVARDQQGVGLICFNDADSASYIGVGQYLTIAAPLATTTRYFERFDDYAKWFDGLLSAKSEKAGDGLWLVKTENEVPIPLVPNVRTEMLYQVQKTTETSTFRYQLKKSNSILAYDGLIILKRRDEKTTELIEYDFFNADWGLASMLGAEQIWKESLRGLYQGDLALKMRVESAAKSDKDILAGSVRMADEKDFSSCLAHKREWLKVLPKH